MALRAQERHPHLLGLLAGVGAGVVVLDLVVVPDGHERVRGVHRAQVWVGLVQAVLGAVLGQRLHLAVAVGAERVLARPLVEVALVDVVAEADHQVGVLGGDRAWAA